MFFYQIITSEPTNDANTLYIHVAVGNAGFKQVIISV